MNPSSQANAGFQRAATKFKQSIPKTLWDQFACDSNSLSSLNVEIKAIQKSHGEKGSLRNMARLGKFIEAMTQFGKVIEVFVNASEFVCFVWGPMKFLLGVAKTHLDTFDKLLNAYDQIGSAIPGHLLYKDMFREHQNLKVILEDYYSDVLQFHEEALKVFGRSKWRDLFHATWKTFDSRFGPILQSLQSRRELLESEKLSASLDHIHIIRQRIDDLYQDQIRAVDDKGREKHRSRMTLIKEKLRAPEYYLDQEVAAGKREGLNTGRWVFEESQYTSWSDHTVSAHSILYLNGIPGAGKTTLVSSIISRLLEVQSSKPSLPHSVAYFYFKHGNSEKNNHDSFLRAVLTQLISQDTATSQGFFEKLSSQADVNIRSRESLQTLTKSALEEYRVSFLVLDGLDECDREQANVTVKWLLSLLGDDRYVDKTSLRILFSGQRDGLLDVLLRPYPAICLESSEHTADIERYCLQYVPKLRKKFPMTKELETEILSLVTTRAQGMFLYARVVLEYLLRQVSIAKLKKTIKPDVFPAKLESAYERIAASIYESEHESERETAQKIIALVVTAKRDLKWREIQSFFCIDSSNGTIDPDERLQVKAKDLCGSLVDVHPINSQASEHEHAVRIVHDTARRYLIHKKIVDDALENARILSFCMEYLTSGPFSRINRSHTVAAHARRAYYSLQDYAVAHWYDHATELAAIRLYDSEDGLEMREESKRAASLLSRFLVDYGSSVDGSGEGDYSVSLQEILDKIPKDERDRTSFLNVEQRTIWIRQEIENLQDLADDEKQILAELHGSNVGYKCHKSWCLLFANGFDKSDERESHMNRHERPFLCPFDGCFGSIVGFESQVTMDQHHRKNHTDAPPVMLQFPTPKQTRSSLDLFRAASRGDIDEVTQLLDDGHNINGTKATQVQTPLWISAKNGRYEVCKLLIERGARLTPSKRGVGAPHILPLVMASEGGHVNTVHLLLKAHEKNNTLAFSRIFVLLKIAIRMKHLELLELLLSFCQSKSDIFVQKRAVLREACGCAQVSMVKLLLQNGFQSEADYSCIEICLHKMKYEPEVSDWAVQILEALLSTGQPKIIEKDWISWLILEGHQATVFMVLSYPKTRLKRFYLKELLDLATEKASANLVDLLNNLLAEATAADENDFYQDFIRNYAPLVGHDT
ncbi:Putative AAA+ ATPase domain, NACHT nucleoside triphosphatase [Colletotrichum destructivum]|uniref:AAA+ ATPase domain, NACHT nucleoside triphosphatase n=1 Tax=Colletotrichum destructivum TaxID=34406 RepID=A0AAX4I390_9PEZI|nr:Putative AAA+ ATPase domain, NACHT nucleoside triphosphatase [Colletotrichum destructivum]